MSKGLRFALEDGEDLSVVAEPVEEVPAEVERDTAEVETDAADIEGNIDDVEASVDDTRAISDIGEVLEESVTPAEDGTGGEGVSPETARVAEIAVEALRTRIGLKKKSTPTPAMEAFGGASSKVAATKLALEGIKEYAVAAWEAVKKAWNVIISKIVEFWKKLFDANTKLANSAKALGAAAEKAKTKKASEVAFDNAAIGAGFGGSSTEATGADVLKVLASHGKLVDGVVTFSGEVEKTLKGFEGVLEQVKAQKADKDAQVIDNKDVFEGLTKLITALAANAKTTFKSETTGGLIEGGSFVVDFTEAGNAAKAYLKAEFKSNPSKASKVKTLSPEEAVSITKAVEELSKKVAALQAKKGLLTSAQKSIDSLIAKAISKAGSLAGNEEGAKGLKEVLNGAKEYTDQIGRVYGTVATTLPNLSIRAEKLALNYVSESLGKYKEASKE
jgi:microcompartment protein CcmK/EutM